MKPNVLLMIAGILFLLGGIAGLFIVSGYDYTAYAGSAVALALGILFWLARSAPASKTRDAIFIAGLVATLGMGLNAVYGQWSGNYMDSAAGYIPGVIWLALAVAFFLVGRASMSTSAS